MFSFRKPSISKPNISNIHVVKPYYLKYDGETGWAQVIGEITKPYISIKVNSRTGGKIDRIMKITKRAFFSDFGGCCSSLHFKRTDLILNH